MNYVFQRVLDQMGVEDIPDEGTKAACENTYYRLVHKFQFRTSERCT